MWKWLEQYFTFTKSERNAVIALIIIAAAVLMIPKAYFYFRPVEHINSSKYDKEIAEFTREYNRGTRTHIATLSDTSTAAIAMYADTNLSKEKKSYNYSNRKRVEETYFDFDPNKIGVAEWVKLGFTEKQAITIEHYKAKGARFYKPTDLKRLFVMTDEHYEKLFPYVKIDVAALPEKRRRND